MVPRSSTPTGDYELDHGDERRGAVGSWIRCGCLVHAYVAADLHLLEPVEAAVGIATDWLREEFGAVFSKAQATAEQHTPAATAAHEAAAPSATGPRGKSPRLSQKHKKQIG